MFPLRLSEIANLVGGELVGETDPKITGLASLDDAQNWDLSFVKTNTEMAKANKSLAAGLLVGREFTRCDKPCVRVDNPYDVFADLLAHQLTEIDRVFPPEIHPTAVIHASANVAGALAIGAHTIIGAGTVVGAGTRLGAQVYLGCDVTIGNDCVIYPQVVVREGCILGDRVIVHAQSVLGSDGFGYLPTERGMKKIPQVGIVEIADDVEIGAGVTIDRATTGKTHIGMGTKLDNQVQIAHNVKVGAHCAFSAQVGIAGSCTLGDGVIAGGQVGVGDHISIGAGTQLAGQSGVISDLPNGSKVFGTPARPVRTAFRLEALIKRLPIMRDTLAELVAKVSQLEQEIAALNSDGALNAPEEEN